MESTPPKSLALIDGKYQLVRLIGEGGMGAVYEARHTGTGRRVAVKLISGDLATNDETVARFQREALASGAIESQHIAHVLDTGVDPKSGSPYMVIELLVGEDLQHAIKRLGPLPTDLALRIAAQACLGLQKAHEANVVHRDVKPGNLYCAERDGGEVVLKILDFGIAKVKMEQLAGENKELTRSGALIGSPLYMSPEQALGRKTIDQRTDIWSLGVVLYEALCGITPHGHAATVGELIMFICSHPSRLVQEHAPWVPLDVAAIVHKALALDPKARFASAAEMYAAIRALLPSGHAIDAAMFMPLSTAARAHVSPRLSLAPEVSVSSPATSSPFAETIPQGSTTGGVGKSDARSGVPVVPRRSLGVTMALAIGAGIAAALVAMFALRGSSDAPASRGAAVVVSAVASIAPSASAASPSAAPTSVAEPSVSSLVDASPSTPDASAPPAKKSSIAPPEPKRTNLQMNAK